MLKGVAYLKLRDRIMCVDSS